MKMKYLSLALLVFTQFANANEQNNLSNEREQVVKQYLANLQNGDAVNMANLFSDDAIVVPTSRASANAKEFFNSFLPNIEIAHTSLDQYFNNETDPDHIAARFHLDYKLKNGESAQGEYMDEFIFEANSSKLTAVYMFENTKFQTYHYTR